MLDQISARRIQVSDAFSRKGWLLPAASVWAVILVAVLVGAVVPGYAEAMGDSYAKLMALPAVLTLGVILLYSRVALLLLIVITRASCDLAFETTRFDLGGMQIGIGGLVNGFVILIALLLVLEKTNVFSKQLIRIWGPFLVTVIIGVALTPDRAPAIRMMLQFLSTFAIFVGAWYVVRSPKDFQLWRDLDPVVVGNSCCVWCLRILERHCV